jgi:thioredoxin 1
MKKERMPFIVAQNDNDIDVVIADYPQVVLDFSGSFCGPCKQIEPVLRDLAGRYQKIAFLKADVNKIPRYVDEYRITNIPALKFFSEGQEIPALAITGANVAGIQKSVQQLAAAATAF